MKKILIAILLFFTITGYAQTYKKGDAVQIEWKNLWYPGKIVEVKGDKFLISYDGYDASWNETVGKDRLKAASTNTTTTTTTATTTSSTTSTTETKWSYKGVESVWDLTLSPDGKYVLAASAYGKLIILNAADLTLVSEIKLTDGRPIFTAAWSHDGNYIATGYSDGNGIVYARKEGVQFTVFDTLEGYASIADVRFNPKKLELAVSGAPIKDYTLSKLDIWDIAKKKIKVKVIDAVKWGTNPTALAYSDDGTKLAVSYAYDRKGIEVFDSTGKIINKINHTVEVDCIDFSPDGGMIVSGGIDCSVSLWNLATNKAVWTKRWNTGSEDYVSAVAFAPNGLSVAACGMGTGTPVKIFNLASGSLLHELGTTNPVGNCISYSGDSKYIFVGYTTYGDIAKVSMVQKFEIPK